MVLEYTHWTVRMIHNNKPIKKKITFMDRIEDKEYLNSML